MNFKDFMSKMRTSKKDIPRKSNPKIVEIATRAINSDFTNDDIDIVRNTNIDKLSLDDKIVLTQALSTFNSDDAVNEMPSNYYTGYFRREVLNDLFTSKDGDTLMSIANNTESEYSSTMIPYMIGKYSSDSDLVKEVTPKTYVTNSRHRVGFVDNIHMSGDDIRELYQISKDAYVKDDLLDITLLSSNVASMKNAPSPASVAEHGLDSLHRPSSLSDFNIHKELDSLGYQMKSDGSDVIIFNDTESYTFSPSDTSETYVNVPEDAPSSIIRSASSAINNNFNDLLDEAINDYRNSKEVVSLSLDDFKCDSISLS